MEKEKLRYRVSRKNFFVKLSVMLMFLSALCILLSNWGFWAKNDSSFIYTRIVLPIVCNFLFAFVIRRLGEKLFSLSFIPVAAGAVYFIFSSSDLDSTLHTILFIAVSIAAVIVYTATVFGLIRTKWILAPFFTLTLAYRIFVTDRSLFFAGDEVTVHGDLISEIPFLCMLLAVTLISFTMKKFDQNEEKSEEQATIDVLLENEEPIGDEPEGDNNE